MNEKQFEQMRKLTQTEEEKKASIQAITNATAKPIKNWTVSFISVATLMAICLMTFYLVTTDFTKPVTTSTEEKSIEKIYYFTNGSMDENTFFEKWSPFYLHVGVVKDSDSLRDFESFLQGLEPISKEDFYNSFSNNNFPATDILINYKDGSERRIKELGSDTFLDMSTNKILSVPPISLYDPKNTYEKPDFKNPHSNLGKAIGVLILFIVPFSMTLWFKHRYPVIKRREWSLNWTHHLLSYLAIALIFGFYSYWESTYGTFHIATYAGIWLLYGACQVAYRLKKKEHLRSIQLTIINHLIGTVALVLCQFGF